LVLDWSVDIPVSVPDGSVCAAGGSVLTVAEEGSAAAAD
jgi:hypothetical protein